MFSYPTVVMIGLAVVSAEVQPSHQLNPRAVLPWKAAGVGSVVFSPDGKTLASGGLDKTVQLWDALTGKPTATLRGHSDYVTSVSFRPDGKALASGAGDEDRSIKLWALASGKNTATLRGHGGIVTSVAWSPDGKTLASGSGDKTAIIWDAESGKILRTFSAGSEVWCVAFSPDGKTLATGGFGEVKLWDLAGGNEAVLTLAKDGDEFVGHTSFVTSIAWAADGKTLVSGSWDKTVKRWDVSSGKCLATYRHTSWVFAVAVSPDGKVLAAGSGGWPRDEEHPRPIPPGIKLWDTASGNSVASFDADKECIRSVGFSPDGKLLVSLGENVKIWQLLPRN